MSSSHTRLFMVLILLQAACMINARNNHFMPINHKKKEIIMHTNNTNDTQNTKGRVSFIDRFLIPAAARQEFMERTKINRGFIKTLPGFVQDAAYERIDEQGNIVFITVAVWENKEAFEKAKEAVQAEYKKQGFNPAAMMERLRITMERGVYTIVND